MFLQKLIVTQELEICRNFMENFVFAEVLRNCPHYITSRHFDRIRLWLDLTAWSFPFRFYEGSLNVYDARI